MTQADLAEKTDMSATYMSHIETGKKRASFELIAPIIQIQDAVRTVATPALTDTCSKRPAKESMGRTGSGETFVTALPQIQQRHC